MHNYAEADFYTDLSLIDDPHSYFDFLRAQGQVVRLPHRNVMARYRAFFEHQRGDRADPRHAV